MNEKFEIISDIELLKSHQQIHFECSSVGIADVEQEIAKRVVDIKEPFLMKCSVEGENGKYNIEMKGKERGTYVKDNVTYPSIYITVDKDEFYNQFEQQILINSKMSEVFLTCINYESNNYKFYHMIPKGDKLNCEWGRIGGSSNSFFAGTRSLKEPYSMSLYWIRYYEKLGKGYIDNSSVYLSNEKLEESENEDPVIKFDPVAKAIYDRLYEFAKKYTNSMLKDIEVNEAQVIRSSELVEELKTITNLEEFNNQIMKLMQIAPRRVDNVKYYLAKNEKEFASIIQREDTLVKSMKTLIGRRTNKNVDKNAFFTHDVEIYKANDEQRQKVLDHLNHDLRKKVKNVYRVIPTEQKIKFEEYCKKNNIKQVKELWHGSVNENWLNIIENSLNITQRAANGRMFGNGVYFAPSSMKSWGYTSWKGTRWARGNSTTAFMGLFACAYGEPKTTFYAHSFTKDELDKEGKNCVHALAGPSLLNDEIVFYDEDAMLMNYLVEFEEPEL